MTTGSDFTDRDKYLTSSFWIRYQSIVLVHVPVFLTIVCTSKSRLLIDFFRHRIRRENCVRFADLTDDDCKQYPVWWYETTFGSMKSPCAEGPRQIRLQNLNARIWY